MDISKIGIGEAPPHDVNVLIEIPQRRRATAIRSTSSSLVRARSSLERSFAAGRSARCS